MFWVITVSVCVAHRGFRGGRSPDARRSAAVHRPGFQLQQKAPDALRIAQKAAQTRDLVGVDVVPQAGRAIAEGGNAAVSGKPGPREDDDLRRFAKERSDCFEILLPAAGLLHVAESGPGPQVISPLMGPLRCRNATQCQANA
jgi:hypothetical protein